MQWRDSSDKATIDESYLPDYNDTCHLKKDTTTMEPVDFFNLFFPTELYDSICNQTNQYAEQYLARNRPLQEHSRMQNWKPVTTAELKVFMALEISMGLVKHSHVEYHWSTHFLLGGTFGKYMSRNRFLQIKSCMHFNDNTNQKPRGHPDYDPLFKIRPIIDVCTATYLNEIIPGKCVSIDESMLKFKGRLFFKQYMPMKPIKWGIKLYALCDSSTGAILKFFVYTGKSTSDTRSATKDIVMSLLEPLYGKGHVVYMDNYYSSLDLFEELRGKQTGATGTVRANRKNLPPTLKSHTLKRGDEAKYFQSDHLVSLAWHDVKRFHMLTSINNIGTVQKTVRAKNDEGHREVRKPVVDYNKHMGGVDLFDQFCSYSHYPHKAHKWYMIIYHFLIEAALVNAFIFFKKQMGAVTQRQFRLKVIDSLLDGYLPTVKAVNRRLSQQGVGDIPSRLTSRCFPSQCPNKSAPDCAVCSDRKNKKRHQTRFRCDSCNVPLCVAPCFARYHSLVKYR